ncbi:hypothetical protein V6R21_31100 [Limibacter armeniacum]|uniref:hypothetical protein n=1 Tax=Limibacter armeniacum TaxID=466084 RepID=UPI002FE67E6D
MKKFRSFLLMALLLGTAQLTYAQEEGGDAQAKANEFTEAAAADGSTKKGCDSRGYCWGEDVTTAKSKYTYFTDLYKAKDYKNPDLLNSLNWLLDSVPYLHENLYAYSLNLYTKLERNAEKAKDTAKQREYQDKILKLYDDRIRYFGDENDNLSKKATVVYDFMKDRDEFKNNLPEYLEFYEKIAEIEGKEKAESRNVTAHAVISYQLAASNKNASIKFKNSDGYKKQMSAILTWEPLIKDEQQGATAKQNVENAKAELAKLKEEFKNTDPDFKKYGDYDEDWFLNKYDELSEVTEYNIENAKNDRDKASWERTQQVLNKILPTIVQVDCDFIEKKMGPQLDANPEDTKLAKRIIQFSLKEKCTDNPYFLPAAITVFNDTKDPGTASVIGSKYLSQDDIAKALEWKQKAADLYEDNPAKKAEVMLDIARLTLRKDGKAAARNVAMDAAKTDSSVAGEAYTFIGDLYMNSYKDCFDVQDEVKTRACYLAAYDMYSKAGNSSKMAKAQEQFPAMSDIFQMASKGYEVGKPISVGCWIGGTTVLRKRP